ncbi:MAG: glycosyltransferase [Candidatus Staskawiczbacteria bacterium]|nr:glycosyltransferase [Candidatus Staskawiczbacteria bacterium]
MAIRKKVLILYASFGAGHKRAAKAIAEAFYEKHPDIEVKIVDVLDFGFEIFRRSAPAVFDYVTAEIPFLYKWMYDFYNYHLACKILNNASDTFIRKRQFIGFIKDFNPDVILSTNPLPMHLVSKTKNRKIIDIPSANVCTDFGFHCFWRNKDVNYYFVQNEEIKNILVSSNVQPEKIKITGIPVSLKFGRPSDREKILSELKFTANQPVLLIVGGKILFKNLLKVVKSVKEKNDLVQFVIIAGRDGKLQKQLEESGLRQDTSVRVFGFVDNLDEYMSVADLVFTKAGGLTVSECLAKGLPMIINDIMPGQERDNVDYLVSNNAGIEVKTLEEVVKSIVDLFSHPEKLAEMKKSCLKISKPNAAVEIADFTASRMQDYML